MRVSKYTYDGCIRVYICLKPSITLFKDQIIMQNKDYTNRVELEFSFNNIKIDNNNGHNL